ncbi:hypothetical protein P3S68_005148 [Capsicum galapagoense]
MHNSFENQRVLPFKITDQVRLRSYLSDSTRPVLRVYMVEKTRENENQNVEEEEEKEDFFDDMLDDLEMNIPDDDQTPTPVDATNTLCSSSQSTQYGNLQDDGTDFFIGMSFKDKNELSNTLFISCVKKDFRIKVISLSSVFCFKCANSNCHWWLREVKKASSNRFVIHKHEKHHTCGSEHISGQNSHATAKVYASMGITKDLVRGTLEHGYEVLDAYRYMIESINLGSKTTLHLNKNGRFKYFFVSYGAWIQGFRYLRKGIAVYGTFLRNRYNGVLLTAVAQDAENHIFPVSFCVADKECDASYEFFLNNCDTAPKIPKSCVLYRIGILSIPKMGSLFITSAYFGCCIRHLGENIQNNYHNERVVTLFYRAAKAYSREEFLEHFNQIEDVNHKVAKFLTRVDFERWSRAFCPANRYNIMTSNIAELVNSLFDNEREFPIKAMFEKISEKYSDFFNERRVQFKCLEKRTRFVLEIEKKISTNISLGNRLFSHKIADCKFRITGHGDVATVDIQTRSCTCRVFDLDKISCPHAMADLRAQYGHKNGREVYENSSQYYLVEKYEMTYSGHLTPVPPEESWVVLVELMERLIPPPYIDPSTIKPGRKLFKKRRGVGESFSSRRNKCSTCKCAGHKRTTCPNHNPP